MLADIASLQGRDGEQDWDASARGGLRTDDNGQQREVAERAVRQKARNFFEGKVVTTRITITIRDHETSISFRVTTVDSNPIHRPQRHHGRAWKREAGCRYGTPIWTVKH